MIDQEDIELQIIQNTYREDKNIQGAQRRKMDELNEVYNRITRHQEDLENGERKARGHLFQVCYDIEK